MCKFVTISQFPVLQRTYIQHYYLSERYYELIDPYVDGQKWSTMSISNGKLRLYSKFSNSSSIIIIQFDDRRQWHNNGHPMFTIIIHSFDDMAHWHTGTCPYIYNLRMCAMRHQLNMDTNSFFLTQYSLFLLQECI